MDIVGIKLRVFGLSALLAGAAGALLGALQVRVGALDFLYFRSLTVLLVATIFGITSVSGALLGAGFFVLLPEVLRNLGSGGGGGLTGSQALQPLIIGALAIAAARRPEGLSGRLRAWLHRVLDPLLATVRRRAGRAAGAPGPATAADEVVLGA
jgi:branched-chain amino acid transport system permease protein